MGKKVSFPAWPFFDAERSKTLVERQDWLGRGWLLCYCCRGVMDQSGGSAGCPVEMAVEAVQD